MKKSELRRLVSEYSSLKLKVDKRYDHKIIEKLKEIEHRYYHETGVEIK
jgi:hypothetical protein